jgi:hypothetical protein
MRNALVTALLTVGVLAGSADRVSAEWFLTPYAGVNWGSTARFNDIIGFYEDQFAPRLDFGASVTWPKGAVGFEFDFGYHPQFFQDRTADDDFEWGDTHVLTFMGNVNYSPAFLRLKGLHPYLAGGFGIIQSHLQEPNEAFTAESRALAINGGGGIMLPLTTRFQLRGDVRYFRSIEDKAPASDVDVAVGKFYFWRGTVGVTMRF